MDMSARPRRAALHQRSDSETNEIRTVPSLHSNNSSVSQKVNDVSSWVPHPTTASISRDSTRSSSRTASTCRCRGGHRNSGSLDSLPPVAPLHINKTESTFIIARDPTAAPARESSHSDTLIGGSNSFLNATPITIKTQIFPKSILKKSSRVVLPPNSTEEYNQRSSSWVGSSSQSPTTPGRARMNARTLRMVHSEGEGEGEGEEGEGEGEEINTVGELVSQELSASGTPSSPRTWRLSESGAHGGRTFPNWSSPVRSLSSVSLQRPDTAGSLFASAKQLPAWARYFYGKKGGRGSVIEPDMPRSSNTQDSATVGRADSRIRRQPSDDSLLITEIILPDAAYHPPRHFASTESIPGVDWIGNRTRIMDPEVATQWSIPHLQHTPLSRFENVDRQLIMFCLGFVLPICWIIAAFLPLPRFHEKINENLHSVTGEFPSYTVDVEAVHGVEDEQRYKNARWWRTVNRILSGVGMAVIGAVVTLGVVAAMRGGV